MLEIEVVIIGHIDADSLKAHPIMDIGPIQCPSVFSAKL